MNISGGSFGRSFQASPGSDVELIGGEFEFNGAAFSGPSITLNADDVFTGTLADGSAFIFEGSDLDFGDIQLTPVALPVVNLSPIVVSTPNPDLPSGLRSGQTLTLQDGGVLADNFAVVNATFNIEGGNVGENAFAAQSTVNISGGTVGNFFQAFSGSQVNISGGSFGSFFNANSGSVVNISSGSLGDTFGANSGSEVNISGGSFGRSFQALPGSGVVLIGGEFKLNGSEFSGSTITLNADDVFTGTFADGSVFSFEELGSGTLAGVQLTQVALPAVNFSPIVVSTSNPDLPLGLRSGQTLTLEDGGELAENFAIVEATVFVEGGSLGSNADVSRSTVNISGGTVGTVFDVFCESEVNISGGSIGFFSSANSSSVINISDGSVGNNFEANDSQVNISGGSVSSGFEANYSEVNISGGSVGSCFEANSGSQVNISGGSVGNDFNADSNSVVNISGGSVGDRFTADFGSQINISGGSVGDRFEAIFTSEVNLFGRDFLLDGVPLDDSLTINTALTILDRNVTLSGLLEDGSAFRFDLNTSESSQNDFFSPNATLTVTLVATTSNGLLGDVNQDGVVDFFDIAPFIAVLSDQIFQFEADINGDTVVDFLDIAPFIATLAGQ